MGLPEPLREEGQRREQGHGVGVSGLRDRWASREHREAGTRGEGGGGVENEEVNREQHRILTVVRRVEKIKKRNKH